MSHTIPDVLSFQRGTIITDGMMSSILLEKNGEEKTVPVKVIRHGIRGVNSHPKNDNSVSNPQRTESAKTQPESKGLSVVFSFKTIPAGSLMFGCSDPVFRNIADGFIDRFFARGVPEFDEVCRRYARNILNGRWLWRNRILGETKVTATVGDKTYHSEGSRLRDFEDYTEDERGLAGAIATGLLSPEGVSSAIQVKGCVMFGFTGEVEVFPSQNMVTNKPKGFARSLYKVDMITRRDMLSIMGSANKDGEEAGDFAADMIDMGRAALRDQKIGNAIRTIDTWYPDFSGTPIPVEPNGASLDANTVFRKGNHNASALLSKMDEMHPGTTFNSDAAFLIAILIRGGVFSEKK